MLIRFSTALSGTYIALLLLYFVSVIFNSNSYTDIQVCLSVTLYTMVNVFGTNSGPNHTAGLRLYYSTISAIFIFLRFVILSYFPLEARFIGIDLQYTSDEISKTMLFIASFSFVFYLAMQSFSNNAEKAELQRCKDKIYVSYGVVILIGFMFCAFNIVLYYIFGLHRGGQIPLPITLLNFATNKDIVAIFTVGITLYCWDYLNNFSRCLFYMWVLAFIVTLAITGAKGGIYTIAISILMVRMVDGDFVFRLTKTKILVAVCALGLGSVFYVIGDAIRYAGYASGTSSLSIIELISLIPNYTNADNLYLLAASISRRLSHFENIALMVNTTDVYAREIINVTSSLKVFLNFVVPGQLFPENTIYSLQLVKAAYNDYSLMMIETGEGIHGDYIPFSAMFYVFFGWLGGLVVVYYVTHLVKYTYGVILRYQSANRIFAILCFWFVYNAAINDAFGLDSLMQESVFYVISTFFYILMLRILGTKLISSS